MSSSSSNSSLWFAGSIGTYQLGEPRVMLSILLLVLCAVLVGVAITFWGAFGPVNANPNNSASSPASIPIRPMTATTGAIGGTASSSPSPTSPSASASAAASVSSNPAAPITELTTTDEAVAILEGEQGSADAVNVVMIYAPWCGACQQAKPQFEEAARMSAAHQVPVRFYRVEAAVIMSHLVRFGAERVPTFIAVSLRDKKQVRFQARPRVAPELLRFAAESAAAAGLGTGQFTLEASPSSTDTPAPTPGSGSAPLPATATAAAATVGAPKP